ncbi:tetratricopeptide repeat protein [Candidatus Saccharibacteria bacterium]|nr:tetratricopeptide repeat protein [Candidatus Saccharibacteria bacterium]MBP9986231.1 tetratricopeptide repeat protein [Candidatus Saccharibacteria bacterium]
MVGLIFLIAIGVGILFYTKSEVIVADEIPVRLSDKLNELWKVAQDSLKDKKYLRAEKALLTILRVDKRNASAYNRLGILYAKQNNYKEAIECFEIAQSLEPSASSLHNVGLIYFETENFEKAALAFEQALAIDNELPARYIAYAKVQEKLGHNNKMIDALEQAVRLEPTPQSLNILADALDTIGEPERALKLREQAGKLLLRKRTGRPVNQVKQPRRVV